MPVVEGQVFLQVALVFGVIGLLGLVLRWTFRRDSPRAKPDGAARPESTRVESTRVESKQPESEQPPASPTSPPAAPARPEPATAGGEAKGEGGKRRRAKDAAPAKGAETRTDSGAAAPAAEQARTVSTPAAPEDYGLLAVAAEVATAEEATKVRRVLTAAGIRSTSTATGEGRYKVLVFGDELIRARRVAGGSQGAGGSQAGSSGS